jgi:hypothetical protein
MYYNDFFGGKRNQYVVAHAKGDVNGDGVAEHVYLTGVRDPDASYIRNITLVIQNQAAGIFASVPLKENAGYDPSLFLGDFTGDGVDDILISIATGGSGGTYIYYVYSFVNNRIRLLFDYEVYNRKYEYDVTYKDHYKVEVVSRANDTKYLIDISLRDPEYLNEIYDGNGKLKKPISGWVDPISGLYPIDRDSDEVYELLAYQKIAGRYHADSLGYIQNNLIWQNNMFTLDNQLAAIFGYNDR